MGRSGTPSAARQPGISGVGPSRLHERGVLVPPAYPTELISLVISATSKRARKGPEPARSCGSGPLTSCFAMTLERSSQKSQSSSSVASALPMTYEEPDPLKKSWFSSALGERADRIAGFTLVTDDGNIAS